MIWFDLCFKRMILVSVLGIVGGGVKIGIGGLIRKLMG